MQSIHEQKLKLIYEHIAEVMMGCLFALCKGSRTTESLRKMMENLVDPEVLQYALSILVKRGLVDFQPDCDSFVWRLKPISTKRITKALKNGAETIDQVVVFIFNDKKTKYPLCCIKSATLATLETMDNVKLVDGKLCLI
jgi:hypothetical protein